MTTVTKDARFRDRVVLEGVRITSDGYLVGQARIARTGIQEYLGSEMGEGHSDVIRVYRPRDEVFSDATMRSFAHRPMTDDHPPEMVSADNWKRFSVGSTGDEVLEEKDGDIRYVRVPLTLMDQDVIEKVQAGKQELSAGYTCDIDWTPGQTDQGEPYDAVQRNIKANHLAVVSRGRAGHQCRIGDGRAVDAGSNLTAPDQQGGQLMSDKLREIVVDGLTIQTTDQGAQAVEKLQGQLIEANDALKSANEAHSVSIAQKDGELGAKDAQIATLKAEQLDVSALDSMVKDRSDVIARAKLIAKDLQTDGLELVAIRRGAVIAKLGDETIDGKSDDYVTGLFDHLAKDGAVQADPVKQVVSGQTVQTSDTGESAAVAAHKAMMDRNSNAWMSQAHQEEG